MVLGIAGVTGIGKSYYKDLLVKELNFEKIKIITTREIRTGEKNNEDKKFVTQEQLEQMRKEGKIAFEFELLGNTYAYTKEELFSNKNVVFELHWETIYDWKKVYPELKTLYLMPTNIEIPKQKTRERNLKPEVENARLLEIDKHYEKITSDENLRKKFDYFVYNCYNKETDKEVINIIKKVMEEVK